MPSKYCKKTDPTYEKIMKRPDYPFSDDLLGMGEVASGMATIISNTDGPFVFNINSPYGTGKTFFMTRLRALMEREFGHRTVYFNAWEFDFYKNPLVAIVAELQGHFEANPIKELEKTGMINQIKDQTIGLVKKMDFSFALEGKITDPHTGLVCSVKPSVSIKAKESPSGNVKKDIFEEYKDFKKLKEEFVTLLNEFLINEQKPLIFFIDELDRCRPDYAIEVLETIKHFFPIKNIIFVLAVDRAQIESTVRTLFGCNTTTEYLKKFIDQDFYLPAADSQKYIYAMCEQHLHDVIEDFCEQDRLMFYMHNLETNHESPAAENALTIIAVYVQALSALYTFSLRTQEQIIIFIKMFFQSLKPGRDVFIPDLAAILICIRFLSPFYFERLNEYDLDKFISKDFLINNIDTNLEKKGLNTYWLDSIKKRELGHYYQHEEADKYSPIQIWSKILRYCYDVDKYKMYNDRPDYFAQVEGYALELRGYPIKYSNIIKSIGKIMDTNKK